MARPSPAARAAVLDLAARSLNSRTRSAPRRSLCVEWTRTSTVGQDVQRRSRRRAALRATCGAADLPQGESADQTFLLGLNWPPASGRSTSTRHTARAAHLDCDGVARVSVRRADYASASARPARWPAAARIDEVERVVIDANVNADVHAFMASTSASIHAPAAHRSGELSAADVAFSQCSPVRLSSSRGFEASRTTGGLVYGDDEKLPRSTILAFSASRFEHCLRHSVVRDLPALQDTSAGRRAKTLRRSERSRP